MVLWLGFISVDRECNAGEPWYEKLSGERLRRCVILLLVAEGKLNGAPAERVMHDRVVCWSFLTSPTRDR